MWLDRIGSYRQVLVAVMALAMVWCWVASAAGAETVTDVIVGHNNKGPYLLSWTDFDVKNIVAVINGRMLKDSDYSIDPTNGMVAFSAVLLEDAIVRITYTTTDKSQRTAGSVNVPVTLNVFNGQNGNLQVTGMHVQTDSKNPDAGKTIVGLSGGKMWGASKVNSQFLMSQQNDAQASAQGNAMDRSVIKLGGETQAGAFRFTGSLLNVGTKFGGEKEYAVAAGRQESGFAVHFAPGKRVEANASIKSAQDTAGANQGTGSVVQEQNVIVSPTDTTKVSLAHSTSLSQTAAQGSDITTETSAAGVNQKIGGATSASVSVQNTTVNAGGKSEGTTTQQVSVVSKPSDNIGVSASVQQTNSDTLGSQVSTNTAVQVSPVKQVSVAASHATVESEKTGVATDTTITFKAAPLSNTEIKGTVVEKNSRDQTQYQRDVSMSSSPVKYARVSAVFSQNGINDQENVTKGAKLELTPLSHTRLAAGYQCVQTGSRVMTIADYSANSKPLRFMEVSGSYRDRQVNQDYLPDTTAVQVAIAPFSFFSLRGGYQANPEDANGAIQAYQATTAGVKVSVGSVALSADLSQKDEYKLMQQSEEHTFGLEMPAFGRGTLTTGYKTARLFGVAGCGTDTYSMGYHHDMGSVFNVSLMGDYTQFNNSADPGKDQYNAQATVGVKF